MMLTSRELAIVLWLAILILWTLTLDGARSSVGSALKTLLSPKLLMLFATIIAYNVAVILWLWRVGYWDPAMLYDTVTFFVVGAVGSVSRAATQGATYDRRFFLKTVLVNLEVMVLFAFLSDFFPFNFLVEFFLVIPVITVLVTLLVVAEHQKGAEQVHRLFSGVQASVGFALIGYVLWQVAKNYEQLLNAHVLFSLGLPFVMSVMFIPILFLACTVFAYEDAFLVVSFKGGRDKRLARWKKRRLFLRFGLNLEALQSFRRSSAIHEYGWLKTRAEAREELVSWSAASESELEREEPVSRG
jgi:chromate transport protein ChrA